MTLFLQRTFNVVVYIISRLLVLLLLTVVTIYRNIILLPVWIGRLVSFIVTLPVIFMSLFVRIEVIFVFLLMTVDIAFIVYRWDDFMRELVQLGTLSFWIDLAYFALLAVVIGIVIGYRFKRENEKEREREAV
ncbi:hypothetical protein SAMN05444487_102236 [Marininema mesophilum]|uniref:Uncharacterized protein n=1 Tax=Marininema mesophilum TaxID=1048340 RepID=A0A1H2SJQ2_9BACL|nr:hypothetical protein [Marininema mesophilum]SDW31820.1 hypothetical protein SAMN05444487_102236 [Marininema mesophilum]